MNETFHVSLKIDETVRLIDEAVVGGSITGECIDAYTVAGPDGKSCAVLVYEKHYYRTSNRLTLTAVVDDMGENTRVHCISGGGGRFFRFDWGAAQSFSSVVQRALERYRI